MQRPEVTTCEVCGLAWTVGEDPEGWTSLEVTRAGADGRATLLDGDFCSQAHAAAWLAGPLPEPEPWVRSEESWPDRLAATCSVLVVLLVLGLLGLGLVTAVRYVLGLV